MLKIIFLALLLAGCSASRVPISPYKIDIQQGNFVTQDMVSKLKPGMTRAQVRFALGTPLVVDVFREDRWDYVYVYQKAGAVTEHRHLAVYFNGDKLDRLEGDVVPARPVEKPKPAPVAAKPKPKPDAAAATQPQPAGATLTTTSGDTVAEPAKPEAAKAGGETEQPKPAQPEEEKGFFGRMLDKIGF